MMSHRFAVGMAALFLHDLFQDTVVGTLRTEVGPERMQPAINETVGVPLLRESAAERRLVIADQRIPNAVGIDGAIANPSKDSPVRRRAVVVR